MKRKVQLKKEQIVRIQDYVETFSSASGQRVLEDLKKSYCGECHVKGDLYETLNKSSKRDLVTKIEETITVFDRFEVEEMKVRDQEE